jgi:ribosomal protein S18 acetylase RimI-like enzyme
MKKFNTRFRKATEVDAKPAVTLIRLSMGDEVDWLFGQEKCCTADEVLEDLFRKKGSRFSHEVCWIAELNNQIAGALFAYPGNKLRQLELCTGMQLVSIWGLGATIRVGFRNISYGDLVEAKRDEFYVSNLAVSPEFQEMGIGTNLLSLADELAGLNGLRKCSLIVAFENPARRLYERCDYKVVNSYAIDHPIIAHGDGGYHRMVKNPPKKI